MSDKFIMGRYIPYDSFVHRLDPRAKILIMVLFLAFVFMANNPWTYAFLFAFVLFAIILSKIPFGFFLRGVRPMLVLILFTVLIQVLFTGSGEVLFSWWVIRITDQGLINGAYIFMRFVLIIFISTLLTLTTEPIKLTDAIEWFLRPLGRLGFPVYEVALMISIALRFIPTLMDEAEGIQNAQKARGMDFTEGNIIERIQNVVPLLVPLFISSFDRAIDLATAMEARGYRGGEGRTRYRQLQWLGTDTWAVLLTIGIGLVVFYLRT